MLETRKIDLTYLLGQTIKWNKVANLGEYDFSQERKDLQFKCLREEANEFIEAHRESDGVEMLDALCDILFVGIYGYFLESNGEVSLSDFVYSYDMIDTEGNEIFRSPNKILEVFSNTILSVFEYPVDGRLEAYQVVCPIVLALGLVLDVNFKAAYENVVESNFTKFPLTDDVMVGAELEWFNAESKYDDVCVEEFEGHFIFRCDGGDGKIVKPRVFCEPKLEQFING